MSEHSNADRPIAVVPCKSDSQRVPWKNELKFAEVPSVVRVLRAALESELFSDILVPALDDRIANLVKRWLGSDVQVYVRPPELDGQRPIGDVWAHAVSTGPNRPTCLLYPNNPLLTSGTVTKSYEVFNAFNRRRLTAVMRYPHPPTRAFQVDGRMRLSSHNTVDFNASTSILGDFYHEAGLLTWTMSSRLPENTALDETVGFVVTPYESWEVDHASDVLIAKALIAARGY